MDFEVNDIIRLGTSLYRVLKIRDNGVPCVIQGVSSVTYRDDTRDPLKDYGKDWHNLGWRLVKKDVAPYQLSVHDKKYEKIILKMKQLDDKFKNKNKVKNVEYAPF